MRALETLALASAALALLASLGGEGWAGNVAALSIFSLVLASIELWADPRRLLLTLSFFGPAIACVLALYILETPEAGAVGLVSVTVAMQGRLFFCRLMRDSETRNLGFAKDLKETIPRQVTVFVDTDIEGITPLAGLLEGHLIRVRPGDPLASDGQVTFGSSFVDESALCGEKEPRTKGMGSFVFGGSLNKNGSFLYRALGTPAQAQVQRQVQGLAHGFPLESLLTSRGLFLEGLVLLVAAVLFTSGQAATATILNVLLASSFTGVAAAAAIRASSLLARSAAEGISWKDKKSLARIGHCQTLVTPPTGVLTEGRMSLSAGMGTEHTSEDAAIRLLAPLARQLETEAAFCLLRERQSRNISLEPVLAFSAGSGGGSGLVTDEEVRWVDLENARLEHLPIAKLESFARSQTSAGNSVHFLLREGKVAAAFAFSDKITPQASAGLALFERMEIPVLVVSPDSEDSLRFLREELKLTHLQPDCGNAEVEALLGKLDHDSLAPAWLALPHQPLPASQGVPVIAAAAAGPAACARAEATTLRSDLGAVARLFRLSRLFMSEERACFRWAFFLQLVFMAAAFRLDTRAAAALSLLPGLWFVLTARQLLQFRF